MKRGVDYLMLAGKVKYSDEEKARWAKVLESLKPGLMMRVLTGDYYDEDEAPSGFLDRNEHVVLIERFDGGAVVRAGTNEVVGRNMCWKVMTRWGVLEKSESYIKQLWTPAE